MTELRARSRCYPELPFPGCSSRARLAGSNIVIRRDHFTCCASTERFLDRIAAFAERPQNRSKSTRDAAEFADAICRRASWLASPSKCRGRPNGQRQANHPYVGRSSPGRTGDPTEVAFGPQIGTTRRMTADEAKGERATASPLVAIAMAISAHTSRTHMRVSRRRSAQGYLTMSFRWLGHCLGQRNSPAGLNCVRLLFDTLAG